MRLTRIPWMRRRQQAFMDRDVEILRSRIERDESGHPVILPPEVVEMVPGRIEFRSVTETGDGGPVVQRTIEVVHVPHETLVLSTDILRIDGVEYNVTGDNENESDAVTLAVLTERRSI